MILTAREIAERGKLALPESSVSAVLSADERRVGLPRKQARVRSVEDPTAARRFSLMHPDFTEDSRLDRFAVKVAGLELVATGGRIETSLESVKDELVRRGWRWMNEPAENFVDERPTAFRR